MAVKFVAEVSSNHAANMDRSLQFIKSAADIGCDAVKFQLFKIDELFAPEIIAKSARHRQRKEWELPESHVPKLANYAHELGLEFSCTPFYLEAVDILEPYVDFFKIASYELLWLKLFERCSVTGKPLVFSTGMADLSEIDTALSACSTLEQSDITILHCNSSYPTPHSEVNLSAIHTLKDYFQQSDTKPQIGWSDHSRNPSVIYRAVHQYNVDMVEFHLDLDGEGEEYAAGHCWLPGEMAEVIKTVREGFEADGKGVVGPTELEMTEREWRADPKDGLRPLLKTRDSFK